MSTIKVDTITDEAGSGAPDFPNGMTGSGSALTGVVKPNDSPTFGSIDVVSSGSTAETIAEFGNAAANGALSIKTNGNLEWGFNALNSRNMTFSTNQTERMRIVSSGNVGIGKTNPATPLDVNGTVTATAYKETVFALTGTTPALDPANGGIQTWTLSGASTPTDSLSSGESMTLMVDDGTAYAITWPTMQWSGGEAPTLAETGYSVIVLWKVGTTLYGASAGAMS